MNEVRKPLDGGQMLELHASLGPGSKETYSLTELDGFFHGIFSLPLAVNPKSDATTRARVEVAESTNTATGNNLLFL